MSEKLWGIILTHTVDEHIYFLSQAER